MPRFHVVYTDLNNADFSVEERLYGEFGASFEYLDLDHNNVDQEEYLRAAARADALLTQRLSVTRQVVAAAPRLKIAVRMGVGYEVLDLEALAERGIPACNVPDYGSEEVAVHALSMLLALRRQVVVYDRDVRAGGWRYLPEGRQIHRLSGQVAGVVGLGRIGSAFAQRAKALFGRVLAADPYVPDEAFTRLGVERVALDGLLRESDVVSLHVPLTAETRYLIGEDELRRMKPTALLANTSRGPVLDQLALAAALREGRLEGAACDVWEHEPALADHPLFSCPNVLASPHVAWYSEEGRVDMKVKAAQEVIRVLSGQPPLNAVNDWQRSRVV
ncbi:MAG: C-terminal binding protein [Chloroflexota bacterium]